MRKISLASLFFLAILQASILLGASNTLALTQLIAVGASAVIGFFTLYWVVCNKYYESVSIASVLALAFFTRLIAIQATPLLEDDYFRYLWDGFQTVTSFNPYLFAPEYYFDHPDVDGAWLDILFNINYPEIPTIYGPVLQGLFAIAYFISPGKVGAIQALLLIVDVSILLLLIQQKVPVRALLIYAVHPLVLKEAMASSHPDILIGGFVLVALVLWNNKQAVWVGACMAIAVATKISALLVLPFLFMPPPNKNYYWTIKASVAFFMVLMLCYLPFLVQGDNDLKALEVFAKDWKFNPLLYRFVDVFFSEKSKIITAVMFLISYAGLFFYWRIYTKYQLPPVDVAFVLLLVFSSVVNPWYGLWIIAPAIYLKRYVLAVGISVLMLAYGNSAVLSDAGLVILSETDYLFVVLWPLTCIQVVVLIGALITDYKKTVIANPSVNPKDDVSVFKVREINV